MTGVHKWRGGELVIEGRATLPDAEEPSRSACLGVSDIIGNRPVNLSYRH